MDSTWDKISSSILEHGPRLIMEYAPKVLLAIFVLVVGLFLINRFTRFIHKMIMKRNGEKTLAKFLSGLMGVLLKVMLLISVASMVGIATTSFIAVLGAMGLAVGLALQGSLANFAGGALILLFRPFKVGDFIEAQGELGTVKEIQIFTTHIVTPQKRLVIIPNGPLSNGNIKNYTVEGLVRVDMTIGIGYGENIKKAKDIIMQIMKDHPAVLSEPAPAIGVSALADSSVNLFLMPHAKPEDYWAVYFGIQEQVKYALDEAGIEIPFPQRVVHQATG